MLSVVAMLACPSCSCAILIGTRRSYGLRPGLTLLAGRTSAGKTTVAAQLAYHVGATAGPVGFFSLEMDRDQTLTRLIAHVGRLNGARLQAGRLLEFEYSAFTKALRGLEDVPLYVDVASDRTVRDIRAASRRLKASRGLALVVVDYLQLLPSPASDRPRTREEEVAKFSRCLKALAKELDVSVLAVAQLSREADRAEQGGPRLSHLRESGALERDAHVVLLLWRPCLHDTTQPKDLVCLKVAKNRQGPTGHIDLRYHAEQFSVPAERRGRTASPISTGQDEAASGEDAENDSKPTANAPASVQRGRPAYGVAESPSHAARACGSRAYDCMLTPAMSPRRRYTFFIDEDLDAGLNALKERDGTSESEAIRRAVREYLERRGVRAESPRAAPQRASTRRKA